MNELMQSVGTPDLTQLKNMLRLHQQIEVLSELVKVCHKTEEGEKTFAVYSGGFNDKVAASTISGDIGFLVTPTNVAKVRREMIGDLRKPNIKKRGVKGRMTDAENRIDDLQRQISSQLDMIGDLIGDFKAHIGSMRAHGRATQGSP